MNWKQLDELTLSDLIGIPYKENGRDLNGVDCYGLAIMAIYILSKRKLIDVAYDNHNEQLSDEFAPLLNIKHVDFIRAGSLLEMRIKNELHIAVAINQKEMIHATTNHGVKISLIGSIPVSKIYEVI